jgi:hypothetical protein
VTFPNLAVTIRSLPRWGFALRRTVVLWESRGTGPADRFWLRAARFSDAAVWLGTVASGWLPSRVLGAHSGAVNAINRLRHTELVVAGLIQVPRSSAGWTRPETLSKRLYLTISNSMAMAADPGHQ